MNSLPSSLRPETRGHGAQSCHLGWALVIFALFLQFWSRYLPSPWAVLVADDWPNLALSSQYASYAEGIWRALQDPNRPFSNMALVVAYRTFGGQRLFWTLVSLAGNSLLLLFTMKMALELTGRRMVAALTGVMFALLPNLTETYHWSTQVLNEVACAMVPYALSGWMWVAYLRRGGAWRLVLAAAAYGVGLFSYEAGILLPGAYLALIAWRREPARGLLRMLPFGLVCLLYVVWRGTNAFGTNQSMYYPPHMQVGRLSLWGISWNFRQIVQGWAGDHFFGAMLSGVQSFATLSPWTRRLLVAGDVAAILLVGWGLRRLENSNEKERAPTPFSGKQVILFGLAWTGAACAISLVSYPAARLNVLPAIGISLLSALLLECRSSRAWAMLLVVPVVLALISNQGTAECFRQAGGMNRSIYKHLQKTASEWRTKQILLFDTRGVRQRQTPGILRPINEDQAFWANCGNAPMARGFTFSGMVRLITGPQTSAIRIVHDVEYGAKIVGDQLLWHERYNPSRPHTNSMADVFVVDCLAASQAAP
jgi:hypothetical protein